MMLSYRSYRVSDTNCNNSVMFCWPFFVSARSACFQLSSHVLINAQTYTYGPRKFYTLAYIELVQRTGS